jgi:hypothetical protein
MWRVSLIVIILCAFAGALFWRFHDVPTKMECHEGKGWVIQAKTDINKGDEFVESKLESVEVDQSKIVQDAVTSTRPLLHRHSGYDLAKGSQVTVSDILETDKSLWLSSDIKELGPRQARPGFGWVVFPIGDIPQGYEISPLKLEMKEIQLGKLPDDRLECGLQARGKRPKDGLSQGQIISEHDLMP